MQQLRARQLSTVRGQIQARGKKRSRHQKNGTQWTRKKNGEKKKGLFAVSVEKKGAR